MQKSSFIDIPIVFIVASPRSGTTLLQTMLDAHPETIAPFESRFLIHFKNRYGHCKKWTKKIKHKFINDVLNEIKISIFWDIDKDKLVSTINALPQEASYGQVCKAVYTSFISFFDKEECEVIIDKNPIYNLFLPELLQIYPSAKFIHLVRDYRATVSSFMKARKNNDGLKADSYRWLIANMEIEKVKEKYPEKFITLTYENLLQNPEKHLKRVSDFLGIAFNDSMCNYFETIEDKQVIYLNNSPTKHIKQLRIEASKTIHKNLTKPIDATFVNKWKENLSGKEIKTSESICGAFAERYNYKPLGKVGATPKIPSKILVSLKHKIKWYYKLPIWLRELKSKPDLQLLTLKK